jgi:hypothetical protein
LLGQRYRSALKFTLTQLLTHSRRICVLDRADPAVDISTAPSRFANKKKQQKQQKQQTG